MSVILGIFSYVTQCKYADRLVLFIYWDDCVTLFNIQIYFFHIYSKRSAYWMIAKIIFSSLFKYQCLASLSLQINGGKTSSAASVFKPLVFLKYLSFASLWLEMERMLFVIAEGEVDKYRAFLNLGLCLHSW